MKFIHIADVHLGASPDAGSAHTPKRAREIWSSLESVTQICRTDNIDMLLIAGDLFHRQPLLRELREVDYLFSQIPDTEVFLIAGNHDYLKKDSYYHTFQWSDNVHMIKSREIACVEVPRLELAVYGCSYHSREETQAKYDTALPEKKQKYEVLLAHGGDEKHIPIQRNKIKSLPYDYIALGHIHKPQQLLPGKAAYPGALEPIDKNDTGPHGYILGQLGSGQISFSFVSCAVREYRHEEIQVDERMTGYGLKKQITETIEKKGIDHIYKMTLAGFRNPQTSFDLNAMDAYGNIIEIVDCTKPAYHFEKLAEQNKNNLIGKFISSFQDCDKDSIEFEALCEGVQALMDTRRG